MGNQSSTHYTHGFHVVRVKPNSPGQEAELTPFFDFIVKANENVLNQQNNLFIQILADNVDKPVRLTVYNSKTETYRETVITPRKWCENERELAGLSIRYCEIKVATEYVWHVLEVMPNSPASTAGLREFSDYIVGSTSIIFQDSEDFFNLVSSSIGKELEFFVYNKISDDIRLVKITPNNNWKGPGCLGCNVAYGLLHKIPKLNTSAPPSSVVDNTVPKVEPLPLSFLQPSPQSVPQPSSYQPNINVYSAGTPTPLTPVPVGLSPYTPTSVVPNTPVSPIQTPVSPKPFTVANPTPAPTSATVNPYSIPHAFSTPNTAVYSPQHQRLPPSTSGTVNLSNTLDLDQLKKRQQDLQAQLAALRNQTPK